MAPQSATSTIAMALAGKTASVDIPKPRSSTFLSAGHGHDTSHRGHPTALPTPPNSISPTLPPQAFKRREVNLPGSPPLGSSHVDSDIDLGDAAVTNTHTQGASTTAHHEDTTGAITPEMLARHYLPQIVVQNGPLAIRHVMGFLTTSVPGFSRIPPAKARRLVVAALERGGHDDNGEVIFEKVGWGRWGARRPFDTSRDAQAHAHAQHSPPSSFSSSYPRRALQIPNSKRDSVAADSPAFSYTDIDYGSHADMLEHEADKMSLDGDGDERSYCSSSEAPDDIEIQDEDWGEEDVTDEEDWAQIGADALRARSLNGGGGFVKGHAGPASSSLAKSAPRKLPVQQLGFSIPEGVMRDGEERTAVEALLRLGSM